VKLSRHASRLPTTSPSPLHKGRDDDEEISRFIAKLDMMELQTALFSLHRAIISPGPNDVIALKDKVSR
jgi:hypothetical protein